VGAGVGNCVGVTVGATVGKRDGVAVVGLLVGAAVVGAAVVGAFVGDADVGLAVGAALVGDRVVHVKPVMLTDSKPPDEVEHPKHPLMANPVQDALNTEQAVSVHSKIVG